MSLSRTRENPTSFEQIETCKRFFILGNCDNARKLHLLLAGRFQDRFFGFLKKTPGQETDPVNMFYVRPLDDVMDLVGAGDFIFLFERDSAVEAGLLEKGVRLGFPMNLLTTFSTYEAPVFNRFLSKHFSLDDKQGIALDIGANFGLTACTLAPYFEVVHAFEPNKSIFSNLTSNDTLCDNIQLHQLAFGEEKGTCTFYDFDGANGSVFNRHTGAPSYTVPMTTIDDFCAEANVRPRLIKIDAEGLDGEIIVSAKETITACKPIIFFENPAAGPHDPEKWEEQLNFIQERYRLYAYPCLNQLVHGEVFGADLTQYAEANQVPALNIAAIPR